MPWWHGTVTGILVYWGIKVDAEHVIHSSLVEMKKIVGIQIIILATHLYNKVMRGVMHH